CGSTSRCMRPAATGSPPKRCCSGVHADGARVHPGRGAGGPVGVRPAGRGRGRGDGLGQRQPGCHPGADGTGGRTAARARPAPGRSFPGGAAAHAQRRRRRCGPGVHGQRGAGRRRAVRVRAARLGEPAGRAPRFPAVRGVPAPGRAAGAPVQAHAGRRAHGSAPGRHPGRSRGTGALPFPGGMDGRVARGHRPRARGRAPDAGTGRHRAGGAGLPDAGAVAVSTRRQRGVALLTVLLLVAVMAVLVVAMLDDIRFALRRAGNAQAVAQAQWHALGAETLAMAQIERLARRDPGFTTLAGGWNGRSFLFPVDDGVIRVTLADATACFNLNSVVQGAGELLTRDETGIAQYQALLEALDFPPAQARALADALADWVDSDQQRAGLGHEDPGYARGRDGYRTAGTLLAEPSELRAIHGYSSAVYARLRPHVCALPTPALSPVNLNTLQDQDAPVLAMLAAGE